MIIGHQRQIKFLRKIVESGKIPHALLFSGQGKLGKKTVAFKVASWLLGGNLETHPDFILIESPGQKSDLAQIQIDQIRELSWRLSLKPMKADLIVGIIDDAHLMTKEAQNCFLKTLEEPKTNSLLILISQYPSFLLPTVLSRCQEIKFYPVRKEEITNFLRRKGIFGESFEELIEISSGRPGAIIDLIKNPKKLEERKFWLKELIRLSQSSLSGRFQLAKTLSQTKDLKEILENWLVYFHNLLIRKSLAQDVSFDFSFSRLKKIIEKIQETFFFISTTNINPRLALEILMLEF
jgi:DNA polymerase-3 subunit delta'